MRCDAVAIRILGLSLAGWNAVISAVLALLAIWGAAQGRLSYSASAANRARARSFSVSLFNWPQAARMSRPRGVRTGLA